MDVRNEINKTIGDLCKVIQRECENPELTNLPNLVQATAHLIQSSEKLL